jgi:hypothetical protein
VHVVSEVLELEPQVKVREDVVLRDTIVADAGVLVPDGHNVGHDVKDTLEAAPWCCWWWRS